MSQKIIIVDGYSSGNLLAPEFKTRKIDADHVQSTEKIWPTLVPSFRPQDFQRNFPFDGNFKKLLEWAQEAKPLAVIAGTETGVELADRLSNALKLANSNGIKSSLARRDKFLMIEACRDAGLRVAQQCKASNWMEAKSWLAGVNLSKYVVKPLKSAWTDQVFICTDLAAVEKAFEEINGSTNKLGIINDAVLIQEFLEGTEYFINSVSCAGQHFFTDSWRYQKRSLHGRDCIYDTDVLLPSEGTIESAMQNYVAKVLDALEIKYGAAHAEVMWGENGPILVEIGARLDGLTVPDYNRKSIGFSGLDVVLDAYLDREKFLQRASHPYPIVKHARTVYLTSYVSGQIKSIPGEVLIRELPSFFQLRLRSQPGTELEPTTNFFTCPGFVNLVHEDENVLQQDYAKIRQIEKTDLFNLEPRI